MVPDHEYQCGKHIQFDKLYINLNAVEGNYKVLMLACISHDYSWKLRSPRGTITPESVTTTATGITWKCSIDRVPRATMVNHEQTADIRFKDLLWVLAAINRPDKVSRKCELVRDSAAVVIKRN